MGMKDGPIQQLRREIGLGETRRDFALVGTLLAIRGLPEGARFNVAVYDDSVDMLSTRGVKNNGSRLDP